MRKISQFLSLVTLSASYLFSSVSANAQTNCDDRECLIDLVDSYLAALVAHRPRQVPMAFNVKFVENIEAKEVGEGLWQSASAVPTTFKVYVPDPVAGQVGFIGVMEVNDKPALLGLRLKILNGQIIEAEHLLVEDIGEDALANLQVPRAGLTQIIPEEDRFHRDSLIGIGASYYLALDYNNGSLAPFADDCARRENGGQTSTNPPDEVPNDFSPFTVLGCADQLDTRVMSYIDSIDNVRVFAADPVTGLSIGFSHFRHSFEENSFGIVGVPGVEERVINMDAFDMPAAHIYAIKDGEIHEIEAMGIFAPYNAPTGWE